VTVKYDSHPMLTHRSYYQINMFFLRRLAE